MKGYFACPIASGENIELARELVKVIEEKGHKVLDRHVVSFSGIEDKLQEFSKNSGIPIKDVNPKTLREQDLKWVMEADFVVLDYTNGSWGGGIEFDHATVVRKLMNLDPIPILCLSKKEKKGSWMVKGACFPKIKFKEYTSVEDAKAIVSEFLEVDLL